MKSWIEEFLRVLYPPVCFGCRETRVESGFICDRCRLALEKVLLNGDMPVLMSAADITEVHVACWYEPPADQLIRGFKYEGHSRLGTGLVGILADGIASWDKLGEKYDLLAPVPLHRVKLRQRGYNQAAILAKLTSERLGIPSELSLLRRNRWTVSQTGLTPAERKANVAGAFEAGRPGEGERVLLIDDVVTSGATAGACAGTLKSAGFSAVSVMSVATPRA